MAHFNRKPPGLSRLSHEIIFEDPEAELEPTLPTSQTRDSFDESPGQRSRVSYNLAKIPSNHSPSSPEPRTPSGKPDENVPLLPLDLGSTQNVLRPSVEWNAHRSQNVGASSLSTIETPSPRNEYRDVFFSPEVDSQKRAHRSRLSDVAHCAVTPSSSPASSKRSPATSISRFPRKRRRHPFARTFEVPQWRLLLLHIGACALVYPVLVVFVIASDGKTLFWARTIIGAGCGVIGGLLGYSLLKLATMILEASSTSTTLIFKVQDSWLTMQCSINLAWATLIHQSRLPNAPGIRLKDLAAQSENSSSILSALRLLWDRHSYRGTDREYRRFYESVEYEFPSSDNKRSNQNILQHSTMVPMDYAVSD